MSSILSLDLGKTLGWAYSEGGVLLQSGIKDLRGEDEFDTFINMHNFIAPFKNVNEVFMEQVMAFTFASDIFCRVGLRTVVGMFCRGARIPLQTVAQSSLKLQFAGHGKSDKKQMCAKAHQIGWTGGAIGTDRDHDEADAIAVQYCILKKRGITLTFKKEDGQCAEIETQNTDE